MCNCIIKPLEWEMTIGHYPAMTVLPDVYVAPEEVVHWGYGAAGTYSVEYDHFTAGPPWSWTSGGKVMGHSDTAESAKAAAQSDYEQQVLSAIASVAPSGAEPAAWQIGECGALYPTKEAADKHVAGWARQNTPCASPRPLYARPQPVAPTGEIAGLVESKARCNCPTLEHCNGSCAPYIGGDLAERLEDWLTYLPMREFCKEALPDIKEAVAALTASEAEAADLRRKLAAAKEDITRGIDEEQRLQSRILRETERAEAAERKLEEAREALEPFGAIPHDYDDDFLGSRTALSDTDELFIKVRRAWLRRARALSTQVEERE